MPYINTTTNVPVDIETKERIKNRLGNAIELLGKSEAWLMIGINDDNTMFFKGDSAPIAFVDISVFGKSSDIQCENMTKEVCKILSEELSISPDKVYVKFSGTNQWGWNNMMF